LLLRTIELFKHESFKHESLVPKIENAATFAKDSVRDRVKVANTHWQRQHSSGLYSCFIGFQLDFCSDSDETGRKGCVTAFEAASGTVGCQLNKGDARAECF
jgi:hypothetical protein